MKRLVRKSSTRTFIHVTSKDRLESILNNGLLPGQDNNYFSDNSLMNQYGVYVSDISIKNDRLSILDELGSVLLELSLNTNNLIPDPEYFNVTGPHSLSQGEIMKILNFIAETDFFQQNYGQKLNIDDYEDIEEFVDEEYYNILNELISPENNLELLKLIPIDMFDEIVDYVYLGNISPEKITKIYILDENNELKEISPKDAINIYTILENY